MIECPWCQSQIEIRDGKCPECNNRVDNVTEADFEDDKPAWYFETDQETRKDGLSVNDMIYNHFKCTRCNNTECRTKEVAMTGTGMSKLFDIQHNHYLFVSCTNCGFVEIYDPSILNGKKSGQLGTIMDILFGG